MRPSSAARSSSVPSTAQRPPILAGCQGKVVDHAFPRRADVALLQARAQDMDLTREQGHEMFADRGIAAEQSEQLALGVHAHAGRYGSDGVAVVRGRKQGGLGEELAFARRVQHDRATIDRGADKADSPGLHAE